MTNSRQFYTDGAVPPTSQWVYVLRKVDHRFIKLVEEGRHISLVGARTMGKTSLLRRSEQHLQRKGIRVALVDLSSHLLPRPETSSSWTIKMCRAAARDLGVPVSRLRPLTIDAQVEAPIRILEEMLTNLLEVCKTGTNRILIALDEIDSLEVLTYVDEIISTFKSVRLERGLDRISFCTIGTLSLTAFTHSTSGTAWNFGSTIIVDDFPPNDADVIGTIAKGFPSSMRTRTKLVEAILEETGGQPFLTMSLANMAAIQGVTSAEEVRSLSVELADSLGRPGGGYFHKIKDFIVKDRLGSSALQTYRRILGEHHAPCTPEPDNPVKVLLQRSGLIRENEQHRLEVKCPIFRKYFNETWTYKAASEAAGRTLQHRGAPPNGKKRRVLIINKGGTLGMVYKKGGVVTPDNIDEFINFFPELKPELAAGNIDYHHIRPDDSVNIYPEDWIELAEFIFRNGPRDYSGVVVCHGTDTMAYTACAVAFALGPSLPFPVVFTGAQLTPDVHHGDARTNLYRACLVAQTPIPEVVISFGDSVYRAVRAQKKDDRRFEGFESATYPPLADIAGEVKVNDKYLRMSQAQARRRSHDFKLEAQFARGVLQVSQYPGLEPEFFDLHLRQTGGGALPDCKGIIIQTLGAGNVANREPYSFIPFLDKAREAGIPVIITSQYPPAPGSHTIYGPAMAPIQSGAIHTGNMTVSAAVTKFRWVLALIDEGEKVKELSQEERLNWVNEMMADDYIGEIDSVKPKPKRKGHVGAVQRFQNRSRCVTVKQSAK